MGMEFEVTSLEDMCSLMCDNALPKKRKSRKERTTMSREERIENIRFQGGMNVMLNVLERLEKAEERITELYGRIADSTFELDIYKAQERRAKKGEADGISDERQSREQ